MYIIYIYVKSCYKEKKHLFSSYQKLKYSPHIRSQKKRKIRRHTHPHVCMYIYMSMCVYICGYIFMYVCLYKHTQYS